MMTQPPQGVPSRVIVAVPCFNEERFIGSIVVKAKKYAHNVLIIDDGSTDNTSDVAEGAGAMVYRHDRNSGYGAAISSALEQGRQLGAQVLVILDGDSQHDPNEIPYLIQPILSGEADIVVGSRFLHEENNGPFYRRLGQRFLTVATNIGSGQRISDSQSGYRAYSSKAIDKLRLSECGMAVSSEIQFLAKENDLRLVEVPIKVSYEDPSKRNPVIHGFGVLSRIVVLSALRHPLLLFGTPGLILLIGGLITGIKVLSTYSDTNELPIGYTLVTILLCLAGLLGIFVGLMLMAMKELIQDKKTRR